MPTILTDGPYRFFFFSGDAGEPVHIHIERDDSVAKFWLDPVRLNDSGGFNAVELRRIERLVENHRDQLIEAWHEYFST